MKQMQAENILKNIVITILLIYAYSEIQNTFRATNFIDKSSAGNLLVAISILSVIACFGNFAFTYEKVDHMKFSARLLAHATTGVLMLLIGLSLEMTAVLVAIMVGNFFIFNMSLLLLYIGSVLYDFWDLQRAEIK